HHGRLSVLSQLAVLQHYGTPTRIIDVTFNPLIGLWFAVEQQWGDDGAPRNENVDGRLFAIDVSDRLINEDEEKRKWEDDPRRPWPRLPSEEDPAERQKEEEAYRRWMNGVLLGARHGLIRELPLRTVVSCSGGCLRHRS